MTFSKTGSRVIAALCAVMVFLCTLATPVYAETAAEKYKRLQKELEETRAVIADCKNDIAAAKKLKAALEQEKALIDQMVEVNKQEIARTETELDEKQQQAAAKRQVIYENDQLLRERLVAIYNMNNASVLSRLLTVDNISDLFTITDALRRISKHDTDLLNLLNTQRQQLETEQAEIDQMLEDLNQYHEQLLQNQQDLANHLQQANANLSRAEAELAAQQEIEGDQIEALKQAQAEMQRIASSLGGSSKGDGSEFVGGRFTWPVPASYRITCEFGSADPNGRPHRGMDVGAPEGTPIVACGNGTVIVAAYAHSSYGNYIVIDHGDGVKTLYAHCSALYVNGGQVVTGQPIAAVGRTGFATGPHLHLEVLNGGGLDNPRAWLMG